MDGRVEVSSGAGANGFGHFAETKWPASGSERNQEILQRGPRFSREACAKG